MLGLPDGAAAAIGSLGEHWDGKGHPVGLSGEEIPLLARIFQLAQTTEVFVRDFGVDVACEMAVSRSGTWFDPALVELLLSLRDDHQFWQSLGRGQPRPAAWRARARPTEDLRGRRPPGSSRRGLCARDRCEVAVHLSPLVARCRAHRCDGDGARHRRGRTTGPQPRRPAPRHRQARNPELDPRQARPADR